VSRLKATQQERAVNALKQHLASAEGAVDAGSLARSYGLPMWLVERFVEERNG